MKPFFLPVDIPAQPVSVPVLKSYQGRRDISSVATKLRRRDRYHSYIVIQYAESGVDNAIPCSSCWTRHLSTCDPREFESTITRKANLVLVFILFYFLIITFTFQPSNSYQVGGFYPRRPSGQAVVTGVYPFPPRYMPFFLRMVQHSHCSSIFIECEYVILSMYLVYTRRELLW